MSRRSQERKNRAKRTQHRRAITVKIKKCPTCNGKRCYPNENAAIDVVGISRGRGGVRVYACPHGHGWHTTSRPRPPRVD